MSKNKFGNSGRDAFLANTADLCFASLECNIAARMKFNFSFVCNDQERNGFIPFCKLSQEQKDMIFDKLQELSRHSRAELEKMPIGSGKHRQSVLAVYRDFPVKTKAERPKSVPIDADWARLRLEGDFRLCGFFIPNELDGKEHEKSKVRFDKNTFYVVFVDPEHNFYQI